MCGDRAANEQRIHIPLRAETALNVQQMWELPLTLYASWWNAGVEAFLPHMPHLQHGPHHEEHDQLVVPEPLEVTGEHALFA